MPSVVRFGFGGDAVAAVVPPAVTEDGEDVGAGAAGGAVGFGVVGETVAGGGLGGVDYGVENGWRVPAEEHQRHFLVLGIDGGEPVEPGMGF
jgi:hypothetical protein